MDLFVALIAFAAALLGGLVQGVMARHVERKKFFEEKKAKVYADFVSALGVIAFSPPGSAESIAAKASLASLRIQIALYGSKDVIRALASIFIKYEDFSSLEAQNSLRDAVWAMRRDIAGKFEFTQGVDSYGLIFGSAREEKLK
jgi:hypothetical protein